MTLGRNVFVLLAPVLVVLGTTSTARAQDSGTSPVPTSFVFSANPFADALANLKAHMDAIFSPSMNVAAPVVATAPGAAEVGVLRAGLVPPNSAVSPLPHAATVAGPLGGTAEAGNPFTQYLNGAVRPTPFAGSNEELSVLRPHPAAPGIATLVDRVGTGDPVREATLR